MVDEQKLRKLAAAATPGVWKANGFSVNSKEHGWSAIANTEFDYDGMAENAAFIAASNPAAILSLLDELQTLREERTAWRVTAENAEAAVKQARIDALEEAKTLIENYPFLLAAKAEICAAIESLKGTP